MLVVRTLLAGVARVDGVHGYGWCEPGRGTHTVSYSYSFPWKYSLTMEILSCQPGSRLFKDSGDSVAGRVFFIQESFSHFGSNRCRAWKAGGEAPQLSNTETVIVIVTGTWKERNTSSCPHSMMLLARGIRPPSQSIMAVPSLGRSFWEGA